MTAFLSVGALACINFSAILAARAAYRPQNLANFWKQARETTATWLFVFFVLLAVAFLFKVSETYSRGATLTFFVVGWAGIMVWHFIIARFIVHALAVGAFAEQKTILLAEEGQLAGSRVIEELNRCGYTQCGFGICAELGLVDKCFAPFLKSMHEILEISRQEPIECVFLLVSWDDRRLDRAADKTATRLVDPDLSLAGSKRRAFSQQSDRQYRNHLDSRTQASAVDCDRTGMQARA